MTRKTGILGVALLLLLASAPAAWPRLAAVGPINPDNGYPLYYQDTNGVAVWSPSPLPWDPPLPSPPPPPYPGGPFGTPVGGGGAVINPPTMIFDPPVPANPFSVQIGFGTEFFYWSCTDAGKVTTPFGKFSFLVGLEASFSNNPPNATNGLQTLFSRLRCTLKSTTLPTGTYILTHPYGVETLSAGSSGINFTRDTPSLAPLNFSAALDSGDVGPFLRQLDPPPVITAGTPPPFDTGWLGDGVTPCTITGSPTGFNQLSLTPPAGVDLGAGPGVPLIINQFIVSGHQYPLPLPTPVTLNRVTYSRDHFSTYLDAFATSAVGASVNLRVPGASSLALTGGVNELAGLFFGRAHISNFFTQGMRGGTFNPGAIASVTAQAGTDLPTTLSQAAVDQVIITRADWSATTGLLTVGAKSTDSLLRSPLRLVNPSFGALVGSGSFPCPIPPATVSVTSPAGGVSTKAVQIVP